MLISVHIPKSGGSSFRQILKDHYGQYLRWDYQDKPIHKSFEQRTDEVVRFSNNLHWINRYIYKIRGIKCIHGHFMPYKYMRFGNDRDVQFITWLRDPVERVISHYYFWKRTSRGKWSSFRQQVADENWSLEKFCLSPELKNLYHLFFWNFPLEKFSFIGITEHFEEDAAYFMHSFLKKPQYEAIPMLNANPEAKGRYSETLSPDFLEEVRQYHAEDYQIYQYALKKREERMSRLASLSK